MTKLVDWLIGLEDGAGAAYSKAATQFRDNPAFHALLVDLADDEKSHGRALRKAKSFIDRTEDLPAVFNLDEEARWDIEAPLIELRSRLEDGRMTEKEVLNFILVIEYSELNELFISVLNAIKERSDGVIDLFTGVEEHKDRIESYLASRPGFEAYINRLKALSGASSERSLLIVDDTESNLNMLKAIFEGQYAVDTARNGAEAFEKLSNGYYSAVISDVDMPVMDGVEFFLKAREIIPGIGGRFIFYSGSLNVERISFFNEHKIKYLIKPASISNIRAAVMDVAS